MAGVYRLPFDNHNPFVAVSSGRSLIFKTGNQRFEKPLFTNKVAPCRNACPIGINIPLALEYASKGDVNIALNIVLRDNPLPGVCGRVCYHPCETECNRGQFDESLTIRSLERSLADKGSTVPEPIIPLQGSPQRIAVVGSGPAGLSAAYHLARFGYAVTVFEARAHPGGMLRYGIPPYRLPREILDREIERILSGGVAVHLNTMVGRNLPWDEVLAFDAVFIAVGLQAGISLPVESDASDDTIITGLDFLAHPDRYSLNNPSHRVLIVGGGNVALDVARTLLRLRGGAGDNIVVICPEAEDQMPALPEEVTESNEEGLRIIHGWAPRTIRQENGDSLTIKMFRAAVKQDEVSDRREIIPQGRETRQYQTDVVISAIGQGLAMDHAPGELEIREGRIHTDRFGRTSLSHVFAGGDASGTTAFVAHAIAAGKQGALAIHSYCEGQPVETEFESSRIGESDAFSLQRLLHGEQAEPADITHVVPFERINTLFFDTNPRQNPQKVPAETRKASSEEVIPGLDPEALEREIARCFRCGLCIDCALCKDFCPDVSILKEPDSDRYMFHPDYCKGCGICSVACPRDIIEMEREVHEEIAER